MCSAVSVVMWCGVIGGCVVSRGVRGSVHVSPWFTLWRASVLGWVGVWSGVSCVVRKRLRCVVMCLTGVQGALEVCLRCVGKAFEVRLSWLCGVFARCFERPSRCV